MRDSATPRRRRTSGYEQAPHCGRTWAWSRGWRARQHLWPRNGLPRSVAARTARIPHRPGWRTETASAGCCTRTAPIVQLRRAAGTGLRPVTHRSSPAVTIGSPEAVRCPPREFCALQLLLEVPSCVIPYACHTNSRRKSGQRALGPTETRQRDVGRVPPPCHLVRGTHRGGRLDRREGKPNEGRHQRGSGWLAMTFLDSSTIIEYLKETATSSSISTTVSPGWPWRSACSRSWTDVLGDLGSPPARKDNGSAASRRSDSTRNLPSRRLSSNTRPLGTTTHYRSVTRWSPPLPALAETAGELHSWYDPLRYEPFEDSGSAAAHYREGQFKPVLEHNLADVHRTWEFGEMIREYTPQRHQHKETLAEAGDKSRNGWFVLSGRAASLRPQIVL